VRRFTTESRCSRQIAPVTGRFPARHRVQTAGRPTINARIYSTE